MYYLFKHLQLSNKYALPTEAKQFLKIERLNEKILETDERIEISKIACDKNKNLISNTSKPYFCVN